MTTPSQVDLFGFGHCCADYLAVLKPFPIKGRKGDVIESAIIGGGPVPTACQTVAKFGKMARFTGKIDDDGDGRLVLDGLDACGVDRSGMLVHPGMRTARAYIWIDPEDGSRTVALDVTGTEFASPNELDERLPATCRFFLTDGRAAEATLKGLKIAKQADAKTMLDAGASRAKIHQMLPLVDYAVVSADFAHTFAPGASGEKLANLLTSAGASVAVVTVGESGAYWQEGKRNGFVSGFKIVPVVDTTGAGDVFHGGLIYGLLEGWDLEQAIRFANGAAALSVRKLSGRMGIPELKEVLQLLDRE